MIIELLVEPLASTRWNLEGSAVAHELHHVPRAIQNGTAMGAILEVGGHNRANARIYFIVNIIRDLSPHFFTVDFDGLFRHVPCPVLDLTLASASCGRHQGRTFSYSRPFFHAPSKPGASASRIINRARSRRVLRSEEHTSELQSRQYIACRLLLAKRNMSISSPSQ